MNWLWNETNRVVKFYRIGFLELREAAMFFSRFLVSKGQGLCFIFYLILLTLVVRSLENTARMQCADPEWCSVFLRRSMFYDPQDPEGAGRYHVGSTAELQVGRFNKIH